ncbi:16S rRNA (cytidine(1402)-2'-O)-methyltransferase [Catenovulum sediminis]|uniref:Ribosomal RNA small subunit methyltransferase I n=1 Tax=Catenovulum sediminis TaxID=1740262 RepID=A0ABV1RFL1_9ALTE|nr:16S rRNA (cytidine(1402)-2'-O)-methyltransferase [Catenovulum sediminis]
MQQAGKLYVVATPIGNLEDITQRALNVLRDVDFIAAEDTRNAQKLLQHYGIQKKCFAYHDHNESNQTPAVIKQLQDGLNIALISDAGTPLINDPGYRLVSQCRQQGLQVVPVPGACAIIAALSAAGVATDQFYFGGFLPAKSQARQSILARLSEQVATAVFYESTHRIIASLKDIQLTLGADKKVVIGRELTKTFETFYTNTVENVLEWMQGDHNQQKGEFVVIIEGAEKLTEVDAKCIKLLESLRPHMPLKTAAGIVAETYGVKKKAVYEAGLQL